MIAILLLFSLVVISSIFLLLILYNYIKNRLTINKIPGPPTLPILGNALDIFVPSDILWVFFRKWSKKYYPIYRIYSVYHTCVQLLSPEDIEKVLSSTKHLQKSGLYHLLEPWLTTGLLTSTGTKWHYRRKILTPGFHFSILKVFIRTFTDHCGLLIKRLDQECGKDSTEILPILAEFTLGSVCGTFRNCFGYSLKFQKNHHASYFKAIHRLGQLIIHRVVRPWFYSNSVYFFTPQYREQTRVLKYLHNFSMSVIQKRKERFKEHVDDNFLDDFDQNKKLAMLDILLSVQRNGADIDDDGIREEVDTFMFEGHDTTLSCLCFTLIVLANHPQVQDKLVEELNGIFGNSNRSATFEDLQSMNYLEMVIKESLRMYPSVPFIARVTDEEFVTKDGYTIPSGTNIHLFIWDVHHNPDIYPDPEKFDPYRFLPENSQKRHHFAYLPFSAGPRNCIGQKYAMLELKVALSGIIRHFVLKPIDTPDDIVFVMDIILRTKNPLRVKFTRR